LTGLDPLLWKFLDPRLTTLALLTSCSSPVCKQTFPGELRFCS
jgi:hypothetical protein